MKILHLISGGDVGGAKTHVLTLLSGLQKTETVRLICFMESAFTQEARELGIDLHIFPSRNMAATAKTLSNMIKSEGFEIIHCHGSRANLVGTMLQAMVRRPVITTVHSDYRLDYLGRPFHRLTYGMINTFCVRQIRYHIGVSDAMAELLIRRGFDPQTMFSIYNGVDFASIQSHGNRTAFFRELGLPVDDHHIVVGIAARLSAVKDIATLIRAFGKAVSRCPDLRLLIAGEGEQRQELEELAARCCPAGSVVFAGWVQDMDRFYDGLDINTLTSLSETFPYALTEGARYRCATVASCVGGVPRLIEPETTGLLFQPQDVETLAGHLIRLAEEPQLRARLGQALYEKASREFSIAATVAHQREIYEVLLRRWNRPLQKRDGVLICGAYGKGNAGDDSILEAILAQMRRIDPDIPVCVLSRNPLETRLRYRVASRHTFDPRFIFTMCRTKLYLSGGGTLLQDVTSTRSLQYYLSNISLAKRCGNQVLLYGCGVGPVSGSKNRRLVGKVVDRCADGITLRDPQSAQELSSMGVQRPEIHLTADPALLLDPAPSAQVDGLLRAHGLDPAGRYVVLVLRPWKGFQEAMPHFARLADRLWAERGLQPLFLALEPHRDLPVCRDTAALCSHPCPVLEAPRQGSLITGLLGRMEAVVSMRLHALIFAAGQGVPLVGVVYDPKVSGFLDYLHQERYVDLSEATDDVLWSMTQDALQSGRDASGAQRLRSLAEQNEEAARALLSKAEGNR